MNKRGRWSDRVQKEAQRLRAERYIKQKASQNVRCPFCDAPLFLRSEGGTYSRSYLRCGFCRKKFVYSDEDVEYFKSNHKTYYNLSYYMKDKKYPKNSAKESQKKPSVPLDQDSVLIYGNSFDCIVPGHKTERLRISVPAKSSKKETRLNNIHAAYCPECKSYYILDHTYKMYEYARIACHVYSKQEARKLLRERSTSNSDARSVLMERGYSVSKAANLPASERHRILREVIATRALSPEEVENYLRTFIKQHETVSQNREAVQKWQEDLEYVIRYSGEMYDRLNTYR